MASTNNGALRLQDKLMIQRLDKLLDQFEIDKSELVAKKIATNLNLLQNRKDSENAVNGFSITLSGWINKNSSQVISARQFEINNPDLALKVKYFHRSDLRRRWKELGAFPGFQISVSGSSNHPFLPQVFSSLNDEPIFLPPSNEDAEINLLGLTPNTFSIIDGKNEVGFIDKIHLTSGIQSALFSQYVGMNIYRLIPFLDTAIGKSFRKNVLDSLVHHPLLGEFRDKIRILDNTNNEYFESDLALIDIKRIYGETEPALDSTMNKLEVFSQLGLYSFEKSNEHFKMPNPVWKSFDEVFVQSGGFVVQKNSNICYEYSADPSREFISGYWHFLFGNSSNPGKALYRPFQVDNEQISEGILIGGRNDSNWYHWMCEYLPRIFSIPEEISENIPLLITERVPPTGLQALKSLTSRPIVTLDSKRAFSVSRLHVVAPPLQLLDTDSTPWNEGISVNPVPLKRLREAAHKTLDASDSPFGKRIFITRKSSHRGVTNENSLIKVAKKHGLFVVDLGEFDWKTQLQIFSNAELIVGASGAVMANYLFMPARSRVIAFTSTYLHNFVLPGVIAEIAEVNFSYLTGQTGIRKSRKVTAQNRMHSSFRISKRKFSKILKRELNFINSNKEFTMPTETNQSHGSLY